MSRRAISSSPIGGALIGGQTIHGWPPSKRNTIPSACSPSIMALAAKNGAPTDLLRWAVANIDANGNTTFVWHRDRLACCPTRTAPNWREVLAAIYHHSFGPSPPQSLRWPESDLGGADS